MPDTTFPIILSRQDGQVVLDGDLTALGGLPSTGPELWQLTSVVVLAADSSEQLGVIELGAAFEPAGQIYGQAAQSFSFPSFTYGATATIATINTVVMALSAPSTSDAVDIIVTVVVVNAAGTEYIRVVGTGTVAEGGTTASILAADFVATTVAGVDLAYDAGTGAIATTAGGIYAVAGIATVAWD